MLYEKYFFINYNFRFDSYFEFYFLDTEFAYYLPIVFLTFSVLFLILYKTKPILKFEFNLIFFKFLIYGVILKFVIIYVNSYHIVLKLPEFKPLYLFLFLAVPFFEEVFFRFYFFEKLKLYTTRNIILISSCLFTLVHLVYIEGGFGFIFIHSILISLYYSKTKNLLMVYLMHIFLNFMTLFMV